MAETVVEFREIPARWDELVTLAAEGSSVILTEGNVPRARLVAIPPPVPQRRMLGLHPGAIHTVDQFDAPLPDDFWTGTQ
jgi:antitoxin (DNA-binding transcriptional repressor) of toxin-antitoxin stability system